jgi:hypothetical protein
MKKCLCSILIMFCIFCTQTSQADGFVAPRRAIRGHTVYLAPLFEYWKSAALPRPTNAPTARPLKAWKLIRGTVVETRSDGWIMNAEVFSTPTNRELKHIFLFHFPAQSAEQKQEIETLESQVKQLNQERESAANISAFNGSRADSYSSDASTVYTVQGPSRRYNDYLKAGDPYRTKEYAANWEWAGAEIKLGEIRKRLESLKNERDNYGTNSEGKIEWFAAETGDKREGLPFYDGGQPW